MAKNIIEDYLVSIGCEVNKTQFDGANKQLQKTSDMLKKFFGLIVGGATAAVGAITGLTLAIGPAGRALGNITMGVDKLALNLHTTTKNARSLKTVFDAMGIDSLDDLKYINLLPEQRKQFMELRKVADDNAPSAQARDGLGELKKLGFEFQKFQVKLTSLGTEFLGSIGQALKEPLFKKVPQILEVLLDLVKIVANEVVLLAKKFGSYRSFSDLNKRGFSDLGSQIRATFGLPKEKPKDWGELFQQFTGKGGKKDYQAFALQSAKKYKVDPSILFAQIQQESGWNPKARSSAGALGIGQFMPATAKAQGINPLNPYQSIDATAKWLKNMMIHYHGNTDAALASYNAGQGAVDKSMRRYDRIPHIPETMNYVSSIKAHAERLRSSGLNSAASLAEKAKPKDTWQPKGFGGVPGGAGVNVSFVINGADSPQATADAVHGRLMPLLSSRNNRGFA